MNTNHQYEFKPVDTDFMIMMINQGIEMHQKSKSFLEHSFTDEESEAWNDGFCRGQLVAYQDIKRIFDRCLKKIG